MAGRSTASFAYRRRHPAARPVHRGPQPRQIATGYRSRHGSQRRWRKNVPDPVFRHGRRTDVAHPRRTVSLQRRRGAGGGRSSSVGRCHVWCSRRLRLKRRHRRYRLRRRCDVIGAVFRVSKRSHGSMMCHVTRDSLVSSVYGKRSAKSSRGPCSDVVNVQLLSQSYILTADEFLENIVRIRP